MDIKYTSGEHWVVQTHTEREAITQTPAMRGQIVEQVAGTAPGLYIADGNGNWQYMAGVDSFGVDATFTGDVTCDTLDADTSIDTDALTCASVDCTTVDAETSVTTGDVDCTTVDAETSVTTALVDSTDVQCETLEADTSIDTPLVTVGALSIKYAETTLDVSGGTVIAVAVPVASVLLGASLNNDTAITYSGGGATYTAAYSTGATANIASGVAATINTKSNKPFDPNAATPITSDTTNITLTPNAGAFATGTVRGRVYYLELASLDDVVV